MDVVKGNGTWYFLRLAIGIETSPKKWPFPIVKLSRNTTFKTAVCSTASLGILEFDHLMLNYKRNFSPHLGDNVPILNDVLKVLRPTVTLQKGSSEVIVDTDKGEKSCTDVKLTADYVADYGNYILLFFRVKIFGFDN